MRERERAVLSFSLSQPLSLSLTLTLGTRGILTESRILHIITCCRKYYKIEEIKNLMASAEVGLGDVVAKHYDNLPEKGKEQRKDSRIYHMRNFNNWIKSTLINEYMEKIKYSQIDDYRCKVLDIGRQILS